MNVKRVAIVTVALARMGIATLCELARPCVVAASLVAIIVTPSAATGGQERPEQGRQLFRNAGCSTCHGPSARGATAPALAGTRRSYPEFLRIVREGLDEMPARPASELSDEQVAVIHQWLVQMPGRPR